MVHDRKRFFGFLRRFGGGTKRIGGGVVLAFPRAGTKLSQKVERIKESEAAFHKQKLKREIERLKLEQQKAKLQASIRRSRRLRA